MLVTMHSFSFNTVHLTVNMDRGLSSWTIRVRPGSTYVVVVLMGNLKVLEYEVEYLVIFSTDEVLCLIAPFELLWIILK